MKWWVYDKVKYLSAKICAFCSASLKSFPAAAITACACEGEVSSITLCTKLSFTSPLSSKPTLLTTALFSTFCTRKPLFTPESGIKAMMAQSSKRMAVLIFCCIRLFSLYDSILKQGAKAAGGKGRQKGQRKILNGVKVKYHQCDGKCQRKQPSCRRGNH